MQLIKNIKTTPFLATLVWLSAQSTALAATVPRDQNCENTTTSVAIRKCVQNNQLIKDVQTIINVLSIGVGLIVVAMIIVGGIQYIAAGDNPSATASAKQRIVNALVALVAYILLFALIQWLVPGGVFE
jgi:hypothetical protein